MRKVFLVSFISLFIIHVAKANSNPCDNLREGDYFVPNPRGCDMYYYCNNEGKPVPGRCPAPFHFNNNDPQDPEVVQGCEWPDSIVPNCKIDEELWNKTCPEQGIAKIPHPYSCSEYSICLDNQQQDRSCPTGLHWSPYDQECVDPEIANCKTDAITCEGGEPFVPLFIPSTRDCSAYYICFNNRTQRFSCGPDQVFNSTVNQCVPKTPDNCDRTNNLSPDVKVPDDLSYDCTNVANNTRIPHPNSCSFWFWCINGNSQIFWCGRETLFDIASRTCTRETLATCNCSECPNKPNDLMAVANENESVLEEEVLMENGKFISIL